MGVVALYPFRALTARMGRIFLLGSMLGWVGEVVLYVGLTGRFINRGFLHGPWMPLYGFGSLAFVLFSRMWKFPPRIPAIFTMGVMMAGILEYSTSLILEGLFGMRWWNYGDVYLSIHGRVWFPALMVFSVLGTTLAVGEEKLFAAERGRLRWLWAFIALVMACDFALSLISPNVGVTIASPV